MSNSKMDNAAKLKREMPDVYNKLLQIRGILNSIIDDKKPKNIPVKNNNTAVQQVHVHGAVHKVQKPAQKAINRPNIQKPANNITKPIVQGNDLDERRKNVHSLIQNMINEIRKKQNMNPGQPIQIKSVKVVPRPNVQKASVNQSQQKSSNKPSNKPIQQKSVQNNKQQTNQNNQTQKPVQKQANQQQKSQQKPVNKPNVQQVRPNYPNQGLKNRTDLNRYI